jgi:hypothetical protein
MLERNKIGIKTNDEDGAMFGSIEIVLLDEDFRKDIRKHIAQYENIRNISGEDDGDVEIVSQVIHELKFSPRECIVQLLAYFSNEDYDSVIYGIFLSLIREGKVDGLYISLVINLAKTEYFLKSYYTIIELHRNRFREKAEYTVIRKFIPKSLAFIYEQFYLRSERNKSYYGTTCSYYPEYARDEEDMFLRIIDEDVINEMEIYCDTERLRDYLPESLGRFLRERKEVPDNGINIKAMLRKGETKKLKEIKKEDFFRAFFYIGQPSVSHFLVYLEMFKDFFALDEEEQVLFCTMFCEYFREWMPFKRTVSAKLLLFGLIDEKIAPQFPEMFGEI